MKKHQAVKIRIEKTLPVAMTHRLKLAMGTIHETIPTPKQYVTTTRVGEVWVNGANDEPVKLLWSEYELEQ
jgi:hypothetical protein